MYVNGVEVASTMLSGVLANWSPDYPLILGRESANTRGWQGVFHLAAFYDRALSAADVAQNYAAGIGR
jgi:hypothetical protein